MFDYNNYTTYKEGKTQKIIDNICTNIYVEIKNKYKNKYTNKNVLYTQYHYILYCIFESSDQIT